MLKASAGKAVRPSLAASDAVATLAVKDLKASRKFYEGVLGLEVEEVRGSDVVRYSTGATRILVYQSELAGTNEATAVTWMCHDVDVVVGGLRARGVVFEHYDFPGVKFEGDVHVAGETRAAWFKDPDGNILAIVSS